MKYMIIICMLFASCSIFRKSVNTVKEESSKSTLTKKDSSGQLSVDVSHVSGVTILSGSTLDSAYDKVTDEVIKDYGDSVITVRTTKEKGQKKTEQISHTSKRDTASSMITEHSQLQEIEQEDSTAVTETNQKDVERTTLLPWWLLLALVPITVVVVAWKRNAIVKFLKPNKKS